MNADRWIEMRTRPDLIVQDVILQSNQCWVVKDPVSMKFYRLQQAEYLIFEALRDNISYSQLKELLSRRFPEQKVSTNSIQQLIIQMQRMGLLVSDSPGQAISLQKERSQERRRKIAGTLATSLISPRFPGFDPERLLTFLYLRLKWMFSGWFTCLALATCFCALTLVATNLEEFYSRLPGFQAFFGLQNLGLMFALLIVTKSVHELGHGLMCKHFGGECHEIGFMLLVFTPAMYCNTSDSWILPNRWHRIAIGAAGMYVEVCLAAICTFIWWNTNPGWVHYLAFNIMFLSSVSTLVFNANPLLRYDGYYMLSDFLEIPNLSQKAKTTLVSKLRKLCLGLKPTNSRHMPNKNRFWFLLYSVASPAYRWFIMIVIFWFLRDILEPYGLSILANTMISISLTGMVVIPLFKSIKFMSAPGRFREVSKPRLAGTIAFLLLACIATGFVPFPHTVMGHATVRPYDPQVVTVTVPGQLKAIHFRPGDLVQKGEVLAVLENHDLELELLGLKGKLKISKSDLAGLELNRNQLIDSERLIAELKVEVRNLSALIELKQFELEQLVLRADRDGAVILGENVPRKPAAPDELQKWDGTPLDPKNIGAQLRPNTVFCLVANLERYETTVVVDEADVQLVASGQSMDLLLESTPWKRLKGTVLEVSQEELTSIPRELSQSTGGPVAVNPSADGLEKPLFTSYKVYCELASSNGVNATELASGFLGRAKIQAGYSTVGSITARYLQNLINFR
ncbi:MAG: biotin/lipoyl-binding protein [Pirellulaceae bacterium]